jgi:2-polyprenyl-3-methyl-5-hydroxy-6-metoxy-1,4-benzoquinol methylase
MAGVSPVLKIADATEFVDEPFDLILHLGTLYHLQDPIKAMRTAARNTKLGGHLFLETMGYEGHDPLDCRLIYGLGGDTTNFWALGLAAIRCVLKDAGFSEVILVGKYEMKIFQGTGMSRVLLHAKR